MKNNKLMTLNIQLFAKTKGNDADEKEKEQEQEEINQADKIAELTIDLDLQKEKYSDIEKKYNELQKRYDDEHKANMRLMDRISKREEENERLEQDHKSKNASILDCYDFTSGKLTFKR